MGLFYYSTSFTTDTWVHVTTIYRGPNDGEGMKVYHDGADIGSTTQKFPRQTDTPSGIVKVGRWFDPPGAGGYGSLYLDELLFWNRQISEADIQLIKDLV